MIPWNIINFRYDESDYENGYSRNLLWRLWHASKALEMDYLHQKSTEVSNSCGRVVSDFESEAKTR